MLQYEDLALARIAELQAEAERDRLARRLPLRTRLAFKPLLAALASAREAIAGWRRAPARRVRRAG